MEAMAASVSITLESNVTQGVTEMIASLGRLDEKAKGSQENLERIAASFKAIGKGATSVDRAVRAIAALGDAKGAAEGIERIAQAIGSVDGKAAGLTDAAIAMRSMSRAKDAAGNVDALAAALGRVADKSAALDQAADAVARISSASRGSAAAGAPAASATGSAHEDGGPDPVMAGVMATGAAVTGFAVLKFGINAATDVASARAQLLKQGWTSAQADAAVEASRKDAQNITGITQMDALATRAALKSVFASVDDANSAAPAMLRMGVAMAHAGETDILPTIEAAAQAGELRGVITDPKTGMVDPARLEQFTRHMTVLDQMTNHRLSSEQLLQFMRTSGIAGAYTGTDDEFGNDVAAMLSMGTSQAGTGLQGFIKQFGAGKMSIAAAKEMVKLGIIKDGQWKKAGLGNVWIDPGALPRDDLVEHPTKYIAQWSDKIHDYDMKTFGRDDPVLQGMEWFRLTSTLPGGKFSSDMNRNAAMQAKYVAAMHELADLDSYAVGAANDPKQQQAAVVAATTSLAAVTVGPAVAQYQRGMASVKALEDSVADYMHTHPAAGVVTTNAGLVGITTFAGAATGATAGYVLGRGPGAEIGVKLGAGAGALVGAGIDVFTASPEGHRKAADMALDASGMGIAAMFIRSIESLFHRESDGSLKVSVSGTQNVRVVNEDSLARMVEDYFTKGLNAPPAGPSGVNSGFGGLHPGQHQ